MVIWMASRTQSDGDALILIIFFKFICRLASKYHRSIYFKWNKKVIFKILNNTIWYSFKLVIFDLNYEINMFKTEKILFSQNYGLEGRIGENHRWETIVSGMRTWFPKTRNAGGIVNPYTDLIRNISLLIEALP